MNPPGCAPVASPCINVCRINRDSGLCEGCLRTLEEIAQWGEADDAQRRLILARVVLRRADDTLRGNCS